MAAPRKMPNCSFLGEVAFFFYFTFSTLALLSSDFRFIQQLFPRYYEFYYFFFWFLFVHQFRKNCFLSHKCVTSEKSWASRIDNKFEEVPFNTNFGGIFTTYSVAFYSSIYVLPFKFKLLH